MNVDAREPGLNRGQQSHGKILSVSLLRYSTFMIVIGGSEVGAKGLKYFILDQIYKELHRLCCATAANQLFPETSLNDRNISIFDGYC